jgi:hypothetical protein
VFAQATLKNADTGFILTRIGRGGQKLQPKGFKAKPSQTQHPLERDGKIATAFRIFCRETAAKKNRHRQRIAR